MKFFESPTILLLLVATGLLVVSTQANAASITILPDPLVAPPGNTAFASVVYSAEGALVSALQFDVLYDPNALSVTNQTTAGSATIAAGKTLDFAPVFPGDTRFIISGLNQNIIGNGSLSDVAFLVSLSAPQGPYPLFLSGIVGVDPNGNPVAITNLNPPAGVPEPAVISLLGIGLGALGVWRRLKAHPL
jgi:PEP-CTERM motif